MFDNIALSGGEQQRVRIVLAVVNRPSILLANDRDDEDARALMTQLRQRTRIGHVELITNAQALKEYQLLTDHSDFYLGDENPLPPVLIVYPIVDPSEQSSLQQVVDQLALEPIVEIVQSDLT